MVSPEAGDSRERIALQLISLLRAMKEMHTVVAPADAPTLERPALVALWHIAEAGCLRPSGLADHLCVDLSTVSRQVGALEQSGWVRRERDPDDRRAYLVRLTDEGERVLRSNQLARREVLTSVLSDWPEADRRQFAEHLARFNEAIQKITRQAGGEMSRRNAGTDRSSS